MYFVFYRSSIYSLRTSLSALVRHERNGAKNHGSGISRIMAPAIRPGWMHQVPQSVSDLHLGRLFEEAEICYYIGLVPFCRKMAPAVSQVWGLGIGALRGVPMIPLYAHHWPSDRRTFLYRRKYIGTCAFIFIHGIPLIVHWEIFILGFAKMHRQKTR